MAQASRIVPQFAPKQKPRPSGAGLKFFRMGTYTTMLPHRAARGKPVATAILEMISLRSSTRAAEASYKACWVSSSVPLSASLANAASHKGKGARTVTIATSSLVGCMIVSCVSVANRTAHVADGFGEHGDPGHSEMP